MLQNLRRTRFLQVFAIMLLYCDCLLDVQKLFQVCQNENNVPQYPSFPSCPQVYIFAPQLRVPKQMSLAVHARGNLLQTWTHSHKLTLLKHSHRIYNLSMLGLQNSEE